MRDDPVKCFNLQGGTGSRGPLGPDGPPGRKVFNTTTYRLSCGSPGSDALMQCYLLFQGDMGSRGMTGILGSLGLQVMLFLIAQ